MAFRSLGLRGRLASLCSAPGLKVSVGTDGFCMGGRRLIRCGFNSHLGNRAKQTTGFGTFCLQSSAMAYYKIGSVFSRGLSALKN